MSLSFNIMFGGNCREAVTFYSTVFKQELPSFITYGESDTSFDPNVKMSDSGKSLIMNAVLNVYGTSLVFNDMPDNFEFIRGNSFGITLSINSKEDAKQIFEKLSEKGQVFVPLAPTEQQGYYGMLADPFDIVWTITCG